MKIFAVSDIHGHYTELKAALDKAGFDSTNTEHMLICCGDCFDRGHENRAVLEYLSALPRKILIRGNHEDILERIIENRYLDALDIRNGTDITIEEFFGSENIDRHGRIDFSQNHEQLEILKNFIASMYDFFETEKHIFTHGWLPITEDDGTAILHPDKEHAPNSLWHDARFTEWFNAYSAGLTVENKTIVCGHRASYNACRIDESRTPDDYSIYFAPGIAALDSATIRTKNINVYVTEDTIPESRTHNMSLMQSAFDKMTEGKKRVEMRLLDEKRSKIAVGDIINFSLVQNPEKKFSVRVTGLHRYDSFSELACDFKPSDLGYTLAHIDDLPYDMEMLYDRQKIEKYGALAIRVSHIL
ncbi:MAG: metallophosphoesterase [Clostridia bacterium]|nr:metallophosphoesterase [Clostridia bacterium]